MTADVNETSPRRARRNIPHGVALIFGANAATQFAIQAWLAYGFADKVWKLRQPLPWLTPVALDVFSIALMCATYMLRHASFRQRMYAWFWLGVAIAAQVGASEGYADHEDWDQWGRVASLFPAVFLAASLHALIIIARRTPVIPEVLTGAEPRVTWWARRTLRRQARKVEVAVAEAVSLPALPPVSIATAHVITARAAATRQLAAPPPPAISPPPLTPVPPATESAPPPTPRPPRPVQPTRPVQVTGRTGRPANPLHADVVKRCVDGDEDAKAVALELGLNPRTAQVWVKRERDQRADSLRSVTAYTSTRAHEIARPAGGPSDAPLPKGS